MMSTPYQKWVVIVTRIKSELLEFHKSLWDFQGRLLEQIDERFPSGVADPASLEELCSTVRQIKIASGVLRTEVNLLRIPEGKDLYQSSWKSVCPIGENYTDVYTLVVREGENIKEELIEAGKKFQYLRQLVMENEVMWENILIREERNLQEVRGLYEQPLGKMLPVIGNAHALLGYRRQIIMVVREYRRQAQKIREEFSPEFHGREITEENVTELLEKYRILVFKWSEPRYQTPHYEKQRETILGKIEILAPLASKFEEVTEQYGELHTLIQGLEKSIKDLPSLVYLRRQGIKDKIESFFGEDKRWPGELIKLVREYVEKE